MAARSTAPLHAVHDGDAYVAPDPETELAALFTREACLKRQLAEVQRALEGARERFGAAAGLLARPRLELLRTRFGPKPEAKAVKP